MAKCLCFYCQYLLSKEVYPIQQPVSAFTNTDAHVAPLQPVLGVLWGMHQLADMIASCTSATATWILLVAVLIQDTKKH